MNRITPTQWAQQGGRQVEQLGSTAAVLEKLSGKPAAMLVGLGQQARVVGAIDDLGLTGSGIRLIPTSAGPTVLWELPPETVLGVDVDAFAGVPRELYADMHRVLSRRFKEVHWG